MAIRSGFITRDAVGTWAAGPALPARRRASTSLAAADAALMRSLRLLLLPLLPLPPVEVEDGAEPPLEALVVDADRLCDARAAPRRSLAAGSTAVKAPAEEMRGCGPLTSDRAVATGVDAVLPAAEAG